MPNWEIQISWEKHFIAPWIWTGTCWFSSVTCIQGNHKLDCIKQAAFPETHSRTHNISEPQTKFDVEMDEMLQDKREASRHEYRPVCTHTYEKTLSPWLIFVIYKVRGFWHRKRWKSSFELWNHTRNTQKRQTKQPRKMWIIVLGIFPAGSCSVQHCICQPAMQGQHCSWALCTNGTADELRVCTHCTTVLPTSNLIATNKI